MRRIWLLLAALAMLAALFVSCAGGAGGPGMEGAAAPGKAVEATVDTGECGGCHETVAGLHTRGRHAGVDCPACHDGLAAHLEDPGPGTRPATNLAPAVCGGCHGSQYASFLEVSLHRPARNEKSLPTGRSPDPLWDKLMMGHGFTKEHDTTRSHPLMLVDHLAVDRAYGGRFQPAVGWQYTVEKADRPLWSVLRDAYPADSEHKAFLPQTAAAANPVCLQCKTQDQILEWAYMGEPGRGARWSRSSNVVEMARAMSNALNCFICHDPHAAAPRIVRDALIDSLSAPDGTTLWHRDPARTGLRVLELGERGYTRKIAILDRYDTRLLCAQCHVEYNCNPGTDLKTGQPVKMDDPRTNHIPFKPVAELYDHYTSLGFLDFRHVLTGGLLWKAQHPEAETFYGSTWAAAGVGCDDCHMPRAKDPGTGREYTSHFALAPRLRPGQTCLRCHEEWSDEEARYVIDSVQAYHRGRMRKAEFWLGALIDKIAEARKAGVSDGVIRQAQDQHLRAHILWEWWTAENSDGFHNPAMARDSLTRSMDESQKGIKLINDALAGK